MQDVLEHIQTWQIRGDSIAVATVINTWGSSPRGPGAKMVVNDKGEMFGQQRFKETIGNNAVLGAKGILESIIEAVGSFRGETPQDDDLTLVVLKYL